MRRCSVPPLRCDTDQYQRYGRYAPSLSDNVVELALIVGDTRAHLALERFHWQDFDTDLTNRLIYTAIAAVFTITSEIPVSS
jgi:hypothetical protein